MDPYHYTVDNRPLTDIEANLVNYGTQGIDSARRAQLIHEIGLYRFLQDNLKIDASGYFLGLGATYSGGTLGINPGSLFIQDAVYTGSTINTIKQAVLSSQSTFAISAPGGAGTSVNYLVQVRFNYLTASVAAPVPYFDQTNTFLPSSVLVGSLSVGIKTGAAAATGTQATPTADAGYLPLYVVTFTNGEAAPTITMATGAPTTKKLRKTIEYFTTLDQGTASPLSGSIGISGTSFPYFNNNTTHTIAGSISATENDICPYLPIRFRVTYASNSNVGTIDMAYAYLCVRPNEGFIGFTTTNVESAPSHGTIFAFSSHLTTAASIPTSAFAGFTGGTFGVNSESILFSITRQGTADAHTGDVHVIKVELIQ